MRMFEWKAPSYRALESIYSPMERYGSEWQKNVCSNKRRQVFVDNNNMFSYFILKRQKSSGMIGIQEKHLKPVRTSAVIFSLHQTNSNEISFKRPYLVRIWMQLWMSVGHTLWSYLDIPRTSIRCLTDICGCPCNIPNIPDVRPMNLHISYL